MKKLAGWVGAIAAFILVSAIVQESFSRPPVENLPGPAQALIDAAPASERRLVREKLEKPFERMIDDPDFRRHMKTMRSESAAQAEGVRLARMGIWMIPDSLMIERTRLMEKIERGVSPEECAAIAGGTAAGGAAMERALGKFDADEMTRWFDLSVDATLRALRGDPAVPVVSDDEGRRLLERASRTMPADLRALVTGQAAAAPRPADVCRIDMALNRFVLEQGSPRGTALMRWLLHPQTAGAS